MQTITLTAEIGNDGILHLTLPTQYAGQRCEVLIVLQPTLATPTDARGWSVGFFEQTAGSLPDFPASDFSGHA